MPIIKSLRSLLLLSIIAFLAIAFLLSYLFVVSDLFGRRTPRPLPEQTTGKVKPEDLRFGVLKAESLLKADNQREAAEVLRSLVRRYPQEADVHYLLAMALLVDMRYTKERKLEGTRIINTSVDEGLSNLRRAVELTPKKKEYLYTYAVGLADFGRNQEAIKEFETIFADNTVRHDSKYRLLILNFADALVAAGLRERALEEYRKSLEAAPDDKQISDAYKTLLRRVSG